MKAKARRSRSFDSGATRMPRMPVTTMSPALQIAQAAAEASGPSLRLDDDHRVHALVLHFDPFAVDPHERVVIAGGVEIFGRAAVALDEPECGVARLDRRAADGEQLREHVVHLLAGRRFDAQPQIGRIAVGAADAELFHFETAVRFDHLVEDLLHDVGIDQVAFGLDDFFKWHETTSLLCARLRPRAV